MAGLIDTACIHPKVVDAILPGLSATEQDLCIASLTLATSMLYIVKRDFVNLYTPGVRKDSIRWDIVQKVIAQAEIAMIVEL